MSLKDSINESFVSYLNDSYSHSFGDNPVARVLSWKEEERNDGYCETCWYEYTAIVFELELEDGTTSRFEISESFTSLIGELTSR